MKQAIDCRWFGYVTVENIEAVADVIREILTGRRYTFASVNENYNPGPPDVRTSQELRPQDHIRHEAVSVSLTPLSDGRAHGHLMVCDTYGVWGLSTTSHDGAGYEAWETEHAPYVSFECNTIKITQRTGAGGLVYWTIAVERRAGTKIMSEYATCPDCGQATAPGTGCLVERVQLDGIGYPRIPYGQGQWYREPHCEDCNVALGQYHHPGCACELCPICRGVQVICGHVPNWAPYRPAPPDQPASAPCWYKARLPIVHTNKRGAFTVSIVKARCYGETCMAIRKVGKHGVQGQPPGEWAIFHIGTGLGLAHARTRAEAEQLAVAMEPLLTNLSAQLQAPITAIRDAYYRRCEDEA